MRYILDMKEVTYSRGAIRNLKRIPKNDRERIVNKINQYAEDPETLANNVIKMSNSNYMRLRVGDWRVVFEETEEMIAILVVDTRGGAYE